MNIPAPPTFISIAILLTTIILILGCSGTSEDVRVTLCKELISALADSPYALVWNGNENRFRRPEYVAVKLLFEMPDRTAGEAICFYDYNTLDENAITHSQPFSAYATLPSQILLNGKPVDKPILFDAITSQHLNYSANVMGILKKWLRNIIERSAEAD